MLIYRDYSVYANRMQLSRKNNFKFNIHIIFWYRSSHTYMKSPRMQIFLHFKHSLWQPLSHGWKSIPYWIFLYNCKGSWAGRKFHPTKILAIIYTVQSPFRFLDKRYKMVSLTPRLKHSPLASSGYRGLFHWSCVCWKDQVACMGIGHAQPQAFLYPSIYYWIWMEVYAT